MAVADSWQCMWLLTLGFGGRELGSESHPCCALAGWSGAGRLAS